MMASPVQMTVRETGDLKRLTRALRQVEGGKQLRRELSTGLRDILRPYVPELRAAYRAAPGRSSTRHRAGTLRGLLAKSVRVEVRLTGKLAGARIRADGRRMPDGLRAIPRYWEGPSVHGWSGRWRHPVFGDRDVWVQQDSHPTFYPALRPTEHQARHKVDQVTNRIIHKLEATR